jgi:hypothetical protein
MSLTADKLRQGASGGGATSSYSIDNSCRFNDNDSPELAWTPSSAGDRKTWTLSTWFKLTSTYGLYTIFGGVHSSWGTYIEVSYDELKISEYVGGGNTTIDVITTQKFRDPSAWYHLVVACDTTQATASDRIKMYINGEQITDFRLSNYPALNLDTAVNQGTEMEFGHFPSQSAEYFDGYLSEVNFVDAQALAPTDFGEFDADYGHWKPIAYAGTYGTNGFYLDFKDSSALGNDVSGNNNDFTATNLASSDQMLDSPTSNFATLNSIDKESSSVTLSEGNLRNNTTSGAYQSVGVTQEIPPTGKVYFEFLHDYDADGNKPVSWYFRNRTSGESLGATPAGTHIIVTDGSSLYVTGKLANGTTFTHTYTGTNTNQIISFAIDNVAGTFSLYRDNSLVVTKTGFGDELNTIINEVYGHSTMSVIANFGQDSSFAGNKTAQGNGEDGDDFYYTPPTGFKSLKASNLPDPAVKPSEHFNVVTWTGNTTDSTTTNTITGVGFEPSLVWTKVRSHTDNHRLLDQVRGGTKKVASNTTVAELTRDYGKISTWGSDGFTVTGADGYEMNYNNSTYVSWCWKANGAGVSNTNGSLTSTVSADVAGGFSILGYSGDNTYPPKTVGHGLSKTPEMIIVKNRDTTNYWYAYHHKLDSTAPEDKYIFFNYTDAVLDANIWGDTAPTSSVFTVYSNSGVAGNGDAMLAYAFHSVPGYSKVGLYLGNGYVNGSFVHCGFKPKYVMIKRVHTSSSWWIMDSARRPINPNGEILLANSSAPTYNYNSQPYGIDLLSNGFKIRTNLADLNYNGNHYIFLAFAETPFKYSNGA